MRKLVFIALAIAMSLGLAVSSARAAPILTFDIDFYGGDTSLTQGVYDTGSTIDLGIGQTVMVDILFSVTEQGVVGGGFDLAFDSANLEASGLVFPDPWSNIFGGSEITEGHVLYEVVAIPPGTVVGPGEDILLATFTFTCTGISLDELWLWDFNDLAQWVSESGLVLDYQLAGGIYLASINNVPIPGTLLLLGSGLVGLLGIRRRIKS